MQVFFSLMAPESSWQAGYQLQSWHQFDRLGDVLKNLKQALEYEIY
jgi:hypothetical protein